MLSSTEITSNPLVMNAVDMLSLQEKKACTESVHLKLNRPNSPIIWRWFKAARWSTDAVDLDCVAFFSPPSIFFLTMKAKKRHPKTKATRMMTT